MPEKSVTLELQTDSAATALLARFPARMVRGKRGVFSLRESGEGRSVILLHGIGSGAGSWVYQLEALGAHYRMIAWDAPGYGDSTPLTSPAPTAGDYADALADLFDALGIERATVVGHSLGALMAAAFARRHSGQMERLMLASPAGGYARASAEERARRLEERLKALAEFGPAEHARLRAPRLLSADPPPSAVALVEWNMARIRPQGYAQAARMLASGDIRADLETWPRPVLVVSGTVDSVTPEAGCRAIAAAARLGRYQSIHGAGHALYLEVPEAFNAILAKYMEETQ